MNALVSKALMAAATASSAGAEEQSDTVGDAPTILDFDARYAVDYEKELGRCVGGRY